MYASVGSIETLGGQVLTMNTPVTRVDAETLLQETAAEIDGLFAGRGYTVPVPASAPLSYTLAGHLNGLAADMLVQSAWPDSPRRELSERLWTAARDMLRSGELDLPDAPVSLAARVASATAGASSL
jgi:hypothetical protein